MQAMKELINPRTKMIALVYVSNTLGSVLRVHDVVTEARKVTAPSSTPEPHQTPSLSVFCI